MTLGYGTNTRDMLPVDMQMLGFKRQQHLQLCALECLSIMRLNYELDFLNQYYHQHFSPRLRLDHTLTTLHFCLEENTEENSNS